MIGYGIIWYIFILLLSLVDPKRRKKRTSSRGLKTDYTKSRIQSNQQSRQTY